jgi:hypothetical protein
MRTNGGPGFEERSLMIPKGCVLSTEEIRTLVVQADERKRRGESWISVVDAPNCDGYQIHVPKSVALTREEGLVILSRANEGKEYLFADLLLSFQDGHLVKHWLTLKGSAPASRLTITGPRRRPAEF